MNNVKLEKRNKTKQFIDLKLNKGNYIFSPIYIR